MPDIHYRSTWTDGLKIDKDGVRDGFRDHVPLYCTLAELRAVTANAHRFAVCIIGGELRAYKYDAADTTTADDAGVTCIVSGDGARYKFTRSGDRESVSAGRTYYVSNAGSNSNTGLSPSSPWQTLQHAVDYISGALNLGPHDVTIQMASGTYAPVLINASHSGAGAIIISGDQATPGNCIIAGGGALACVRARDGGRISIRGVSCQNPTGFALWIAEAGGIIRSAGTNECGAVGAHQLLAEAAQIFMTHTMRVVGGGAGSHLISFSNGYIYTQSGAWVIVGAPHFGSFAQASSGGVIFTFANSFTGNTAGARFSVILNGAIQTNTGGNVNHFPGTAPGATSSGGQYS